MKQIGTINVQKTKLQTSVISSFTQVFKTTYVECVSNEFCDKLELFIDDLYYRQQVLQQQERVTPPSGHYT